MKLPHDKNYFPDNKLPPIGRDGSTPDERLDHADHEAGILGADGKPSDWRDKIVDRLAAKKR